MLGSSALAWACGRRGLSREAVCWVSAALSRYDKTCPGFSDTRLNLTSGSYTIGHSGFEGRNLLK